MSHLKLFIIAFLVFVITDNIWLGIVAKNMYFEAYASWLRLEGGQLQPVWWAVAIVYILFALSIVFFVAPLSGNNLLHAVAYGALLGLIIYGIYDFTLLALMKNWPIKLGIIDCAWGVFLCAWSSTLSLFIFRRFFS